MANIKGFHHISLHTTDFDKSLEFYTKGLGFTVSRAWGEGDSRAVMLDVGDGGCIEMFAGGAKNSYNLRDKFTTENLDEIPKFDAGIWGHLCFRVDDADAAYKTAIEAGAVSAKSPMDAAIQSNPVMNIRIAFLLGPDGEVIEMFQIND